MDVYADFHMETLQRYADPECDSTDIYWDTNAFGGTSAATPHVAAVMAAVLSRNEDLDGEDAEAIVCMTAVDHIDGECAPGWDMYSGHGRPNLLAAMTLASSETYQRGTVPADSVTVTFDGSGTATFWNVPDVTSGEHDFNRWKVQKAVGLKTTFDDPVAWGRSQGARGWREIELSDDTFDYERENLWHTGVHSVSEEKIVLKTWYYDIFVDGDTLTFPDPDSLKLSYTVMEWAHSSHLASRTTPEPRHRLIMHPNPAHGDARLVLQQPRAHPDDRLQLFTVTGRRIRALQIPTSGVVEWDLRDEQGRLVPTGLYFARVGGTTADKLTKVIIVR